MNYTLLMMGGSGTRFGTNIPKQYVLIDSVPVFTYILRRYNEIKQIDKIIIVSNSDWIDYVNKWVEKIHADKVVAVIQGGDTRSESVFNGLKKIKKLNGNENDVVLIHDATHPYVDEKGINSIINAVKKTGAATLGSKQFDTIYRIDVSGNISEVIPREQIISAGSPEAFLFEKIYEIYSESTQEALQKMTSAGAMALSHGFKMTVIPASQINLKITYPDDMLLFEKLVHTYFFPSKE